MISKTHIVDFFDPYNVEHLQAYGHLSAQGTWPKGFIPKNVEVSGLWSVMIACKMADVLVKLGLAGKIEGMPKA